MQTIILNRDDPTVRSAEIRLYCLSMAIVAYPAMGRHDGVEKVAESFEKWVLSGAPSLGVAAARFAEGLQKLAEERTAELQGSGAPDDAGSVGGAADPNRDTSRDVGRVQDGGGAGASGTPPSLRQQGGGKDKAGSGGSKD